MKLVEDEEIEPLLRECGEISAMLKGLSAKLAAKKSGS
jgi:hypothetical protein